MIQYVTDITHNWTMVIIITFVLTQKFGQNVEVESFYQTLKTSIYPICALHIILQACT